MGIHDVPPASGPSGASIRLEDFREAAIQNDQVIIHYDGQNWSVKGLGTMPGSQRQVAWVQTPDTQTDTTSVFVEALQQSYSNGIARAVANALSLQLTPGPGKPLSSRVVDTALDMASSSQNSLSGVDFLTKLHFSASSVGAEFQRVCQHLGLDPAQLQGPQAQQIDHRMSNLFTDAANNGQSPVSYEQAAQWLEQVLLDIKNS